MDSPTLTNNSHESMMDTADLQEVTRSLSRIKVAETPYGPAALFDLLGGRTMEDFAALRREERRDILGMHLRAGKSIEMHEFMHLSEHDVTQSFLALKGQFGNSKLGQQLTEEARCVFYEENDFLIWLNDLDIFCHDILGEDGIGSLPVTSLVRSVTVLVERHQYRSGNLTTLFEKAAVFSNWDTISFEWRDLKTRNRAVKE